MNVLSPENRNPSLFCYRLKDKSITIYFYGNAVFATFWLAGVFNSQPLTRLYQKLQ